MSADKKIPPRPNKDTIYIDIDDEITGIIDKVEAAKSKVVALVLPKRSTALQSIVNMRLLKRSADNAGKNVVLITGEAALLPLAGATGLHVAKSLTSRPEIPPGPAGAAAPLPTPEPVEEGNAIKITDNSSDTDGEDLPSKISYDKSIGELAEAHDIEHPETIELGDEEDPIESAAKSTEKLPKAPKDRALKVPNFDKFRLFLGLGIAGLIALIIFIYLAVTVLPKATIAITTTSTPVSANFTLNASGSASSFNPDQNTIPAFSKTSDQTTNQTVQATGQQNNGDKASGKVTLTQDPCSHAVTIPAGTGVSSGGLTFITGKTITLSPQGFDSSGNIICSGDVSVTAQQGGSKYNLAAGSNFAVAGYSGVVGSNSDAFSGGTDNIQTIVSQSDLDSVKQKLTSSSSSDNYAKNFENQLSQQGYYVLTSTLKQSDPVVSASPAVGQPASNTTVTAKVTYTVLAVKQNDLKAAISNALSDQIDKSKQKLDDDTVLKDADITVANQTSDTSAVLSVSENTSAVPLIDATSVKQQSMGKKSGDITSSISAVPGVKNVTVKLSPFWVSKVPKKPNKVTVTIQHINGS